MKKNRPNEIRKSIDSLTALLICAEKEREWLESTLDIKVLVLTREIQIANERELTEIALAYGITDMVITPWAYDGGVGYSEKLSIEVNGMRFFALASSYA